MNTLHVLKIASGLQMAYGAALVFQTLHNEWDGDLAHGQIQRGIGGPPPPPPPLKNHKNIGLLSNTGPDPLENKKATKPAFHVGPPSARQRNAIDVFFFKKSFQNESQHIIIKYLDTKQLKI